VPNSISQSDPIAERLERAARAVAAAQGYTYRGDSLVSAAKTNPRADQFVRIARAVIIALQEYPWQPSSTGPSA
jgi:hypothetical protein